MTDNLTSLSDDSLLRYYEGLREQAEADLKSGVRFMGEAGKRRATTLLTEIRRRGLSVAPIYWPNDGAGSR
jgi:hypothetical protein